MKYAKEKHVVFQEADVTQILVDYLKNKGEKAIPPADEIEFSFDKYKHGNEITLMFDDITEQDVEDIWQAELEELRYDEPITVNGAKREKVK